MIKRINNSVWEVNATSRGTKVPEGNLMVEVSKEGIVVDSNLITWEDIDNARNVIKHDISNCKERIDSDSEGSCQKDKRGIEVLYL